MDQKRSNLKWILRRIGQDDQGGSTGSDGLDRSDESRWAVEINWMEKINWELKLVKRRESWRVFVFSAPVSPPFLTHHHHHRRHHHHHHHHHHLHHYHHHHHHHHHHIAISNIISIIITIFDIIFSMLYTIVSIALQCISFRCHHFHGRQFHATGNHQHELFDQLTFQRQACCVHRCLKLSIQRYLECQGKCAIEIKSNSRPTLVSIAFAIVT